MPSSSTGSHPPDARDLRLCRKADASRLRRRHLRCRRGAGVGVKDLCAGGQRRAGVELRLGLAAEGPPGGVAAGHGHVLKPRRGRGAARSDERVGGLRLAPRKGRVDEGGRGAVDEGDGGVATEVRECGVCTHGCL